MKPPIVIIGIGELAGVFSRGFLRCGYPVYPITRNMDIRDEFHQIPNPELVLITVPENQLQSTLKTIPADWRAKISLLQNELLPRDWEKHRLMDPTITIVWFEKKKNKELTNILYSPSFGKQAQLISNALQSLNIPSPILNNEEELLYELVRKALYIFTVNIAGLVNNCTVGELWEEHRELAEKIAIEIISIQQFLTGRVLQVQPLLKGIEEGIKDCPDRYCLGRNAFLRLERALGYAKEAGIKTPKLMEIYHNSPK